MKCDVMVGKSRRAERIAWPRACIWSEPVNARKRVNTEWVLEERNMTWAFSIELGV